MPELVQPKGIFSGVSLPKGWTNQISNLEAYVHSLGLVCPDMEIVSQITRGVNSTTFVLKSIEGLRVCQIRSFSHDNSGVSGYLDAKERIAYLRSKGISVPNIYTSGEVSIGNELREYVVMDYIKGVSVDTFLSKNPHKNKEVYEKIGVILGQLSEIPLEKPKGSANEQILLAAKKTADYLERNKIITSKNAQKLIRRLKKRLNLLGESRMAYVHLDPFPVNIQVTGSLNDYRLTLLDVEAIKEGHSLVEGLGRALKWGIYDWNYISGNTDVNESSLVHTFLHGYSQFSADATIYQQDSSKLALLLDTTELVSLPTTIMRESMKEEPAEYFEWSKGRLLELIEKV